jgi:hypothetical protein
VNVSMDIDGQTEVVPSQYVAYNDNDRVFFRPPNPIANNA